MALGSGMAMGPADADRGNGGMEGLQLLQAGEAVQGLEPRLQYLVSRRAHGSTLEAGVSTLPNEVAVIAMVTDAEQWRELPDVVPGIAIPTGAGAFIVTGRVPVKRVASLGQEACVLNLGASRPLQPTLAAGKSNTKVDGALASLGGAGAGQGVVVGIIDIGCDFAHKNFIGDDGGSRIEAIWDQSAAHRASDPVDYGRIYRKAEIEAALATDDPYGTLGYGPRPDTALSLGSHGTHVMDIAVGSGKGSGVSGVAPDASILFVEIDNSDIPWQGEKVVNFSFGDSVRLVEAVDWIFREAGDRPCVINISLGTNGGPHDGSTLVEQGLDDLLRDKANRAVVIAAGNSYDHHIHAAGDVPAGGAIEIPWSIPSAQLTQSEIECWFDDGDARIAIELLGPGGQALGVALPENSATLPDVNGDTILYISGTRRDTNNKLATRGIFIEQGMPNGNWTIRLINMGQDSVAFHAWIERNDNGQSAFAGPFADSSVTLGSISCGRETIAVASYDAHKQAAPISSFSSSGPTRDGREKPEVSAPGHNVEAARSRTSTAVIRKSGTSMAAPMVTGAIALLLGEASRRGVSLSSSRIRQIVSDSAQSSTGGWDNRFGNGRLDVERIIRHLGPP